MGQVGVLLTAANLEGTLVGDRLPERLLERQESLHLTTFEGQQWRLYRKWLLGPKLSNAVLT